MVEVSTSVLTVEKEKIMQKEKRPLFGLYSPTYLIVICLFFPCPTLSVSIFL